MSKDNHNNIFDLSYSICHIKNEIPKGFQDGVSDDIFNRIILNAMDAQYYLNRLNEYCKSNYELKLVNLRDNH